MPSRIASSINPPELVVVTGANGFIAQHCVAHLLKQGYNVVGAVRTAAKAEIVENTHGYHPKLRTVIVADITSSQAYTSALRDLRPSAILHLASPFQYGVTEFERDMMVPAVKGSLALLEAAREMTSVKRVVQTSSFSCVFDPFAGPCPGQTYTDDDWSPLTYDDGIHASDAPSAYRASKTAAEKASWDFMDEHKPRFDLVALCPGMVFGPWLEGSLPSAMRDINTSNRLVWNVVSAGAESPVPPTRGPVWVDVRDVAKSHIRSLQVPEAGGSRFIIAKGVYCNQEIADEARKVAAAKMRKSVPIGEPGKREAHLHFGVSAKQAEDVLGMRWTGLGECLGELLPQLFEVERRDMMGEV